MTNTRLELAIGVAGLAGFLITTVLVLSGASQSTDFQATLQVNQYDLGPIGTSLMVVLTDYGREVVWGLLVVVTFLLGDKRTKLVAVELVLLFVVGIFLGDALKILISRQRPLDSGIILRVPADIGPSSFPSGHALIVSIGAALCAVRFRHKAVAAVLIVEATLVCYSRVYVGVHYATDIVGGVFLGIAIALLGAPLFDKYLRAILEKLLEPIVLVLREGPLNV